MKNVCILTSAHNPEDVRIYHKEAISLARAGYCITIITPWHESVVTPEGIKIVAVKKPKTRLERFILTTAKILKKAISQRADIYHFHDPDLLPLMIILGVMRKNVIYDVHEDYPRDILGKQWLPPQIRQCAAWIISLVEWIGAHFFYAIVTSTPKIAERFPAYKTLIVQNFPVSSAFVEDKTLPYQQRDMAFVYIGSIAEVRGACEMVQAVGNLNKATHAGLHLAGDYSPESLETVLKVLPGWAMVTFHGYLTQTQVSKLLNNVRAGLVVLHPTLCYPDAYPVKMFEYMAAGLPVIASDFPLWREIIEGANCGLLVNPLDVKAIANAMQWILDHPEEAEAMGKNGKKAVKLKYNWQFESRKLLALYEHLKG